MAWQTLFERDDGYTAKRWLPDPEEKRYIDARGIERSKRKRPAKFYKSKTGRPWSMYSASERQDMRAKEYAEWLANRDGIELPAATRICRAEYIWIDGKRERRVRSVEWHRKGQPSVVIEIPHWDHVPDVIEEHDLEEAAA